MSTLLRLWATAQDTDPGESLNRSRPEDSTGILPEMVQGAGTQRVEVLVSWEVRYWSLGWQWWSKALKQKKLYKEGPQR